MHPELMYQLFANTRQPEAIRSAEVARLAKLVQRDQPNHAQELLNHVVAFAKRTGARNIETAQTGELPQIDLSRKQA